MSYELGSVLRLAVAEGPVFLLHFDEVDDDVFATLAQALVETVSYSFIKGTFHIDGTPFVHRDLNDQRVRGALDPQVGRVYDQSTGGVLCDDLETVVFGSF